LRESPLRERQDFFELVTASDLRDAGIDIGLPFNGSAPDLGPFESAQ
jgi:hypothetical protein